MLKKLLTGAAIVALTGCASLGDVFVSGSNAAYIMDQNGQSVSNLILKADLTADELSKVQSAQKTIADLREKFSSIEPENLLLLHVNYLNAKTAYENVYDVVVAHKAEYTDDEWQLFTDAHNVAVTLDNAVNDYIMQSDTENALTMGVKYLNAAAKLAAVL